LKVNFGVLPLLIQSGPKIGVQFLVVKLNVVVQILLTATIHYNSPIPFFGWRDSPIYKDKFVHPSTYKYIGDQITMEF
jgi:hypothetical protein